MLTCNWADRQNALQSNRFGYKEIIVFPRLTGPKPKLMVHSLAQEIGHFFKRETYSTYFQDLIFPAQYSETEAIKKLKSCYIRASFIKPL